MSLPDARLCRPTSPRCWPACRCETGLTGPSLAMGLPKIHGTRTMAPPPAARGGSLCPVTACPASNLPLPITTEKREARTAGLGCAGLSSERKGFSRSCFRPSPPRVYACTSCSPILRRATSTHLVPVAPPPRSICSKRSSLPAITPVTDRSHAYAAAVNSLTQA